MSVMRPVQAKVSKKKKTAKKPAERGRWKTAGVEGMLISNVEMLIGEELLSGGDYSGPAFIFIHLYGSVRGHLIAILICSSKVRLFIIPGSWSESTAAAHALDSAYEYAHRKLW